MCKVLKQFTEGKGRNLVKFWHFLRDETCKPPPPPPTLVKLRQRSGKIPVKIFIFSGKMCVIKSLFVWNDNHFCQMYSQFTSNLCANLL
jgi:hypothetical protein